MYKDNSKPVSYWKDWYWNKGGREKVQAKRKLTSINGFIGFKMKRD